MSSTLAMVLAGGRGKRMDILCHLRPKPALPFAGRLKVIDFTLSTCVYSGIKDIAVLTDYQRSHMADYLRRWHLVNANSLDFSILEPRAGSYRATADAVYQNLAYLDKRKADTVLVLAGDHVYKLDYRKMLAFRRKVGADVAVGVIPVPVEPAHRFGTVALGNDGRILKFLEKSPASRSSLASMGVYVFNRRILSKRLTEDAEDENSPHDFGCSILPDMVKRDKVFAYRFRGYWQDIGTVEAYYEANMELTRDQPSFSLNGSSPVLTHERLLSTPRIVNQANIRNSLVSPGCVIRGRVENSILSSGVRVDEGAVVKNSVVMENTSIGGYSVVDRCVLDDEVNVGDYCYVGFGSALVPGSWDVTILGKGVTVPPHTAIGRNCKVLPQVGFSDFSTRVVPAGSVISKKTSSLEPLKEPMANLRIR